MKCKYCGEKVRKGFDKGVEVLMSYIPFNKFGAWGWCAHYCELEDKEK